MCNTQYWGWKIKQNYQILRINDKNYSSSSQQEVTDIQSCRLMCLTVIANTLFSLQIRHCLVDKCTSLLLQQGEVSVSRYMYVCFLSLKEILRKKGERGEEGKKKNRSASVSAVLQTLGVCKCLAVFVRQLQGRHQVVKTIPSVI